MKSTGNAKLLEALCQRGLQISDAGYTALTAMDISADGTTAVAAAQPSMLKRQGAPPLLVATAIMEREDKLMAKPNMTPPAPHPARLAITRGQAHFQYQVATICSAAIDAAQLPRVIAYIVAEYSVITDDNGLHMQSNLSVCDCYYRCISSHRWTSWPK